MNISLILDESSAELFADDGLTVMTEIFFPETPYNQIHIKTSDGYYLKKIRVYKTGKHLALRYFFFRAL